MIVAKFLVLIATVYQGADGNELFLGVNEPVFEDIEDGVFAVFAAVVFGAGGGADDFDNEVRGRCIIEADDGFTVLHFSPEVGS